MLSFQLFFFGSSLSHWADWLCSTRHGQNGQTSVKGLHNAAQTHTTHTVPSLIRSLFSLSLSGSLSVALFLFLFLYLFPSLSLSFSLSRARSHTFIYSRFLAAAEGLPVCVVVTDASFLGVIGGPRESEGELV